MIVEADVPSASIDVGDATTVDVDNDADPGATVTDRLSDPLEEIDPSVTDTVADSAL